MTRIDDIDAIHAVFARLVEAWNSADGLAFGTLFTADADYIDVTGTHTVGGEAIGKLHQFLFHGPLKGSTLEYSGESGEVHFLTDDVALVIQGGASKLEGQAAAPADRVSINTNILMKQNGLWKIRAFQNNRVTSMNFGPPR